MVECGPIPMVCLPVAVSYTNHYWPWLKHVVALNLDDDYWFSTWLLNGYVTLVVMYERLVLGPTAGPVAIRF